MENVANPTNANPTPFSIVLPADSALIVRYVVLVRLPDEFYQRYYVRLIIPFIIVLFGAGIGLLVNSILNGREDISDVPPYLSMIAGGLGAFVGMFLRDIFGLTMFDSLLDTGIASLVGAAVFAASAHLVLRARR